MIKGLPVCAMLLTLGSPAFAGDRPGDKPPIRRAVPVDSTAAALQQGRISGLGARPLAPFVLPVASSKTAEHLLRADLATVRASRPVRRFDLNSVEGEDASTDSLRLAESGAGDGGRYAVRDTLSDYRKPRFRRSALGTMLTLRLDGEEESPAFSVGGGGVAAVVWQAMPKS